MFKSGLIPRQENVPLTIDAQYVPGFDWLRNTEIRIVKDWDKKVWLGIEAASPQAVSTGAAPFGTGGVLSTFNCNSQLDPQTQLFFGLHAGCHCEAGRRSGLGSL